MKKIAWKLWWVITPQNLENLYQSMPWYMQAIIDNQGARLNIEGSICTF